VTPPSSLIAARDTLKAWLLRDALPLWWEIGADRRDGGYFDTLDLQGRAIAGVKRARVQARQVVCYSLAGEMGCADPWREAMRHGWSFIDQRHRRGDGLYNAFGGEGFGGSADLYDQAFMLLALARLQRAGEPGARDAAEALIALLPRHEDGGFHGLDGAPLASNPNMHMFEAALAWIDTGGDGPWREIAAGLARLATTRLIDPETGALGEIFEVGWRPPADPSDQRVEPGHQFEWAWLLMRWRQASGDASALATALRLVDLTERVGVDRARGVAINALDGALAPVDRAARLWPQTERLRATLLASELTGDITLWESAEEAVAALCRYLEMATPGLWRDQMQADGAFVVEPAKASSFYHIVGAIRELDRVVG
jgi:mannose/cellobiose epimerase-like protein (N-acyl-D-glucosamine 2-epimerase family)